MKKTNNNKELKKMKISFLHNLSKYIKLSK